MRAAVLVIFSACMMSACTKKASEAECAQAVDHMIELIQKQASEKMKEELARAGAPSSVEPGKGLDQAMKNMQVTGVWENARKAHLQECSRQPQTRANCISNATSVDELISNCGMKSIPQSNGVTLQWPN